ncbi:MAG: ribosome silencing factor [Bacteroidota bacterium]|jgi:ribosome-associated protein
MAKKVKKAGEEQLLDIVVQGMQELKAKNIVILDLRKLESAMADYFVIASGSSSTHVEAIANSVEKFTEENLDESPRRIEGKRNGKWVLMDYFNTIVHVFDEETRDFYAIEQLWGDGEFTRIQD